MNNFIYNMINATKTGDVSWPGEGHAFVHAQIENCCCSKQLQWFDGLI